MNKKRLMVAVMLLPFFWMSAAVGGAGPRWTPLGPEGGDVRALAVDPSEADTVFALTSVGLFKSTDGALSWRPVNRRLVPSGRDRILIDPRNSDLLYVMTPGALVRSRDGGATWTAADSGVPRFSRSDMAMDPSDSRRLYVATSFEGIYLTEDEGATWRRMGRADTDTVRRGSLMVATHPTDSLTLFIGVIGGTPGTFKSSDRGMTWKKVNDVSFQKVLGHPDFPDRFYALERSGGGVSTAKLYRSLDRGNTWENFYTKSGPADIQLTDFLLDPVTGLPRFATTDSGPIESRDGGLTWSPLNSAPAERFAYAIASDGRTPQTLYLGSSRRGVLRSLDEGATWRRATFQQNALNPFQLAVNPLNPNVLYATRGLQEGDIQKSSDGGVTWQELSGYTQSVGSLALDPVNPNTVYLATGQNNLNWAFWRSLDAGANWSKRSDIMPKEGTQWVVKLVVDPANPSRIFAAAFGSLGVTQLPERSGVYRSLDGGVTWKYVLAAGDIFTVVLDPSNANVVYAGSGANIVGDGVYKSTNGGVDWVKMNNGLPDTAIQNLDIDPRKPGHLYAQPLGSSMYRTTNGGGSWSVFRAGAEEVSSMAFHPTQPVSYAVTRTGTVLRSRDGGTTWQSIGAPPRFPQSLEFVRDDADLVIANTAEGGYLFPSPHWLFAPGDPAHTGNRFDGVAISNSNDFQTGLKLRSLEPQGVAGLAVQAETNQSHNASMNLAAKRQLAKLRSELFSGDVGDPAWIELFADSQVSTFFQYGAGDLSRLDGGVAVETPARRIIFRQVFQGPKAFRGRQVTTRISLFNPGPRRVTVQLRYFPPGPPATAVQAENMASRNLPAGGFVDEPASQFFPGDLKGGWVEAVTEEGSGIVGFAVVEFPAAKTLLGFNAVSEASSRQLFSAQFAAAPGSLFTELNLVNIGRAPRRATITAVLNDGQLLDDPVEVQLQPGESFTRDAAALFPGTPSFVGSLKVEIDGEGVVGGVIFGDPSAWRFAAALALQAKAFNEAVFSQVASVPGVFFTGLAFFYPETDPAAPDAEIEIQVVRADGQTVGTALRRLRPGERVAALVEEFVTAALGQAGGYTRINSNHPVVGQMLFGALANGQIQLFSAVPPSEL